MPKKLAVLAVAFALVLSVATPSFAIAQEEPPPDGLQPQPTPGGQDETTSDLTVSPANTVVCSPQAVPQVASQEEATELPAAANPGSPTPGPEGGDMVDESFTVTDSGDNGNQCSPQSGVNTGGVEQETESSDSSDSSDPACASCGVRVAQAAQEVITGDDTGPSPTEMFGVALQAARDTGSSATGEAEALEETRQSSTPVEDSKAAAYQAAFEAAKEAGADDETAKETAKQAVTEATFKEAAKGEALTGEASKTSKDDASEEETTEDDASEGAKEETASTEETTKDDTAADDEEIAATSSGEDGGSSNASEDVTSSGAPAGSRAPLLLGGVALLSVGGYAALMFARSWPSSSRSPEGRRLLGH